MPSCAELWLQGKPRSRVTSMPGARNNTRETLSQRGKTPRGVLALDVHLEGAD